MTRPTLSKNLSKSDFLDFYWLKEELVEFCRHNGINASGGKIEISQRIALFLETGEVIKKSGGSKPKKSSRFDWNNEILSMETILTDSYKNGENVRAFFKREIGNSFHFTVTFMDWIKQNYGKTLSDAVEEWNRIEQLKKDPTFKTEIAPQFEYNQYMRAFLKDNPTLSAKDAMHYWKLKRNLRGSNQYSKEDLDVT